MKKYKHWEDMTLDELLAYLEERDKWELNLLVQLEGFEKTCEILADNGKI